jgi:putative transcriptional regulator
MRSHGEKSPESLAGSLLVAHPALRDANFRHVVVLMTAHGPEGAMGVIVNRPLERSLRELGGDFALGPLAAVPLFNGGPVQKEQLILAGWRTQPHGFQLHLGIDPQKAASLFDTEGVSLRAFLGYAGWSAGQLENELKSGSWIVADAPTDLFAHPADESLWRTILSGEGEEWRLLADEPDDPEVN